MPLHQADNNYKTLTNHFKQHIATLQIFLANCNLKNKQETQVQWFKQVHMRNARKYNNGKWWNSKRVRWYLPSLFNIIT